MRDPDERAASLALRDGGPASVRRAVDWYRTHDRLHCGDQITMAADALAAYQADTAAGKDALLVCDTTEMADALNQRIHRDTIDADAPTVAGARGQRIAVGDLIISRRNDPTIAATQRQRPSGRTEPGAQRQPLARRRASTPTTNRLAAERLDDGARVVFDGDYVREHITHGYAVTVHSAQGVTADTTHAVLGENTTRAMLYVAMTRGRDTNTAYLYERATEQEYGRDPLPGAHVMNRGTARTPVVSPAPSSPTTTSRSPHTRSLPKRPAPHCPNACAASTTAAHPRSSGGGQPTKAGKQTRRASPGR